MQASRWPWMQLVRSVFSKGKIESNDHPAGSYPFVDDLRDELLTSHLSQGLCKGEADGAVDPKPLKEHHLFSI